MSFIILSDNLLTPDFYSARMNKTISNKDQVRFFEKVMQLVLQKTLFSSLMFNVRLNKANKVIALFFVEDK
jgi:hypothetical protein